MVQMMDDRGTFESLAIQTNIQIMHILSYLYCELFGEKYSGSGSSPSFTKDKKTESDSSCDTFKERNVIQVYVMKSATTPKICKENMSLTA